MSDLAQLASEITPRNIGGLSAKGKIVFGKQTDSEMLEILHAQLNDPDRNPTFDSELQREINLVQKRMRLNPQPEENPQDPPQKQSESVSSDLQQMLIQKYAASVANKPRESTNSLITETEALQESYGAVGLIPEKIDTKPSWGEIFGAVHQQSLGSIGETFADHIERIQAQQRARFYGNETPDYDFTNDIKGYENWAMDFIESGSPEETSVIKRRLDRDLDSRQTIEAGYGAAVAAEFAYGLLNPINLVPIGGQVVRSARLGDTLLRSAGKAAITGAAVQTPYEAVLQGTLPTRTATESAISIGTVSFLSGILGPIGMMAARDAVPILARRLDNDLSVPPSSLPDPITEPNSIGGPPGSVGAMRVDEGERLMKGALGAENLGRVSGGVRLALSEEVATRRAAARLLEQPWYMNGDEIAPIAAVTRIDIWEGDLAQRIVNTKKAWLEHKNGDAAVKYSLAEFEDQIGRAMRREDTHPDPHVAREAQKWRQYSDALKEAGIETKLLQADGLKVKGATSWFSRLYRHGKIMKESEEFERRLVGWLTNSEEYVAAVAKQTGREAKEVKDEIAKVTSRMDALEATQAARDIIDHILGTPDGRINYEPIPMKRGPLKDRILNVPDFWIEDFLEDNVALVMHHVTRTMAPDIEITRAMGSLDLADDITKIRDGYNAKIAANPAASEKLKKAMATDIDNLKSATDLVRGTYALPKNPNAVHVRLGRGVRRINYLSDMGQVALTSTTDIGKIVMVQGLWRVLKDGIVPFVTNFSRMRFAMREAKVLGSIWEMVLNTRARNLADIGDAYGRHSKPERAIEYLASKFGNINMLNVWNDVMKSFTSYLSMNNLLRSSVKPLAKRTAREIEEMNFLGISPEMADRIATQFQKHGDSGKNGEAWLANTSTWDDAEAVFALKAALSKDVNRTIVTPKPGDLPFMASTEVGKMLFQYKSFAFASIPRTLIPAMQRRDRASLNGAIISVAIGMGVYALYQKASGKKTSENPMVWLREGVDRSGLLGWIYEAGNITEKMTAGRIGPRALTGGDVSTRYQNRNFLGALLGPTAGSVEDVHKITTDISAGDVDKYTTRAARRILPYQNLFYARWLFDIAEEAINDEYGL